MGTCIDVTEIGWITLKWIFQLLIDPLLDKIKVSLQILTPQTHVSAPVPVNASPGWESEEQKDPRCICRRKPSSIKARPQQQFWEPYSVSVCSLDRSSSLLLFSSHPVFSKLLFWINLASSLDFYPGWGRRTPLPLHNHSGNSFVSVYWICIFYDSAMSV